MDTEAHLIINQQEIYALLFQSYPDVVNIAEMCEMLGGISSKTAYKLLQENQISHFKIGRTYKIPKVNILLYLNIFTFERPHCDALVH
ncbi:DNA-binding protein [Paenibacillus sp. FSL P4-0081]|uniref:helix-turn-helix domain-containing protein n=1 Tax=unclassified Paenibacillus TaxID=185978 RepID=UPI0004F6F55B|nr:helix-turn-helix domain-containing protein [Paenibacillus sp. FSL P4-0081]AIQ31605.1 DNA-binding protein [Paenibacillus sp. FSL P4-0081]